MLVSSCASMMITHPDFDQQRQQIKAIGIMPPDLQMFSETENSSERRPELDAEAAKHQFQIPHWKGHRGVICS